MQTFTEEHFYAWQYERPSSPYTWLLSVLLAIVVLACCLFPLAPQAMKVRCQSSTDLSLCDPGTACRQARFCQYCTYACWAVSKQHTLILLSQCKPGLSALRWRIEEHSLSQRLAPTSRPPADDGRRASEH